MRDHKAVERDERSQGSREMKDHKAVKKYEKSQGKRER